MSHKTLAFSAVCGSAPVLEQSGTTWTDVCAALVRRERAAEIRHRFVLPAHTIRTGVSGRFGAGSTTAIAGGAPVPLTQRSESLSFYPVGTMILNEVTLASRMSYVLVQIDPELASRLLAEDTAPLALRPMAALADDIVAALVKTLVPATDGCASPEQLYAEQAALMLLLTIQQRSAGRSPVVFHTGGLAANQFAKVTDYLLDHPPNDVSLQELATLTSLSPTHLRRAFKASTGRPRIAGVSPRVSILRRGICPPQRCRSPRSV